jgi:hypothetical protein
VILQGTTAWAGVDIKINAWEAVGSRQSLNVGAWELELTLNHAHFSLRRRDDRARH